MKQLVLLLTVIVMCSCNSPIQDDIRYDYDNFKDTPAWELAQAVDNGDTLAINRILKRDSTLIDYQEPYHKMTMLMMTIYNQKRATFPYSLFCDNKYCGLWLDRSQWRSFCNLLKKGASLEIVDKYGRTPLMIACGGTGNDIKFAEKLIQYGADVNAKCPDEYVEDEGSSSALMYAAWNYDGLSFVKLLVENGADVNYVDKFQNSALRKSMHNKKYDVALYLLEHGADYNVPISRKCDHFFNSTDSTYLNLVEELRYEMWPLDSKEHKAKMRIVDFLKKKGVDYRSYPVPNKIKKYAKDEYNDTWKEYLTKY